MPVARRWRAPPAHRRSADASADRKPTARPREKWRRPPRRRAYTCLTQTLHVLIVTPATAGVQGAPRKCLLPLDSRLRGNDGVARFDENHGVRLSSRERSEALLAREVVAGLDVTDG